MNKKVTAAFAVATSVLSAASLVAAPASVLAWGDSAGGRPSYTVAEINNGALKGKIVFNSISNSVSGDEKNFVSALAATDDVKGTWQGNNITVENGKEYLIRLYVHNNATGGWDAVAKDTKVAVSLPSISAKQVQVNGFITSSNATPNQYWDYVNFNSDTAFHLEYVYGSAVLYNNGIGSAETGYPLSDDIVTKAGSNNGTLIGFEDLDGRVPGCYNFDNYVTIKVKAVYDTDFTVDQKVRIAGTKEWKDSVDAKVGDKVEYQIEYRNTSDVQQNDVAIKDILPKNMKYVAGTTKVWNATYPNGELVNSDAIVTNGINIGNYKAKSNAFIRFTAEVVDNSLKCGDNSLVNWAQVGVAGTTIQDYATVNTGKVCVSELPTTGPEAMAAGVIAAGSIVTAAGYAIASRRALR